MNYDMRTWGQQMAIVCIKLYVYKWIIFEFEIKMTFLKNIMFKIANQFLTSGNSDGWIKFWRNPKEFWCHSKSDDIPSNCDKFLISSDAESQGIFIYNSRIINKNVMMEF